MMGSIVAIGSPVLAWAAIRQLPLPMEAIEPTAAHWRKRLEQVANPSEGVAPRVIALRDVILRAPAVFAARGVEIAADAGDQRLLGEVIQLSSGLRADVVEALRGRFDAAVCAHRHDPLPPLCGVLGVAGDVSDLRRLARATRLADVAVRQAVHQAMRELQAERVGRAS